MPPVPQVTVSLSRATNVLEEEREHRFFPRSVCPSPCVIPTEYDVL